MTQAVASGEVLSSVDPTHVFQGNEILKVSANDSSRMDAPSISLGEQKITLKRGQSFPIKFQFSYDKSRAGKGYGGLMINARIEDENGQLLYLNDTSTELVDNVQLNVIKI